MANASDVSITIGADTSQLETAMASAQNAIKTAVNGMQGHLETLTGALGKIQGMFIAFAAVVAGAGVFDKAVGATTKFTGEVVTLSKQLGISTEEASGLNVALGDIGSDADTYTSALQKLTKQVRTNEEALNAMGIVTRDSNGNFLNGRALMDSALKALMDYKEGTDRNLAAQVAFGRGAGDVTKLLKLSSQVQEEATEKAKALGLVVGSDNVDAVKRFKLATNDVNDVLLAIENVIGNAMIPVLTKLANWFSEGGPTAVSAFKVVMTGVGDVLNVVADIFIELWDTAKDVLGEIGSMFGSDMIGVKSWGELFKNVFTIIEVVLLSAKMVFLDYFNFVRGEIEVVIAELKGLAGVTKAALTLDWDGVKSAWASGMQGVSDAVAKAQKRIVDQTQQTAAKIQNLINPSAREFRASDNYGDAAKKGGTRSFQDPTPGGKAQDTSKAQFAVAKAELEADANIQKEYLKETQESYDDAYAHNLVSTEDYYAKRLQIARDSIQAEIDAKQQEIDANAAAQKTAQTAVAGLQLKAEEIKLVGHLTVLQAQYANSSITNTREMTAAERQRADALREVQIASQANIGSSQVAMDRIALDQRKQLRQTSDADAIQEERAFEDRLTAIQAQAIIDRRTLEEQGNRDPAKIASFNAQLEQLERDHQEKLTQLDEQATLERNKYAIQAAQAVQSSFETFFNDLTDRTKKLSDTFKDFGKSLLTAFNQAESKKLAEALVGSGTSGGGILMGILGKLFPAGAAAKAPAAAAASGPNDVAGLQALDSAAASTSGSLTQLSDTGISGMFKSATDWIGKQLIGTTAQAAQNAISQTMTTAFTSLTSAAYSAATALQSVTGGGGGGATSGAAGAIGGGNTNDSAFAGFFDDVPSFDVGTDFVPQDMLAMIHKGERITPARFNSAPDRNVALTQHINVPQSTSRASAAQIAGMVAISTATALRRNG